LDFVFSRAYNPNDFEKMLPAQYKIKNFMTGSNYMVKENGRIVANVGAYPAAYHVCGDEFRVSAITSVGVHHRARSKGYMKELMKMALDDMRDENVALSFLQGLRQRYEYFGYAPCGVQLDFSCNINNIRHHFKGAFKSDIVLKEIHTGDTEAFGNVFHRHHARKAHIKRPHERFADIMDTWEDRTVGIYAGDALIGCLSATKDRDTVCEIDMDDYTLIGEVLGVYLNQHKRYDVKIEVFPHETALITELSKFTESVSAGQSLSLNVLDYPVILNAFLKLKCETAVLPDGELTVCIRDTGNITIKVSDNRPSVSVTDEKPSLECTHLEAMRLFFSPASAFSLGMLDGNAFARALFPVPLFIMKNDKS
jgi:GNAT superfamily N-acetyltransferase